MRCFFYDSVFPHGFEILALDASLSAVRGYKKDKKFGPSQLSGAKLNIMVSSESLESCESCSSTRYVIYTITLYTVLLLLFDLFVVL